MDNLGIQCHGLEKKKDGAHAF
ncbi:uncharacterized protein G2W53_019763 [Senna tora]|uniref:Uncharacterized protein n=1 Tax=Senna tora TaxID=362788 RepID=A0A834U2I3_9FABA|nr:uncharacterized protein G2W53_019763 [Senna tora]